MTHQLPPLPCTALFRGLLQSDPKYQYATKVRRTQALQDEVQIGVVCWSLFEWY